MKRGRVVIGVALVVIAAGAVVAGSFGRGRTDTPDSASVAVWPQGASAGQTGTASIPNVVRHAGPRFDEYPPEVVQALTDPKNKDKVILLRRVNGKIKVDKIVDPSQVKGERPIIAPGRP